MPGNDEDVTNKIEEKTFNIKDPSSDYRPEILGISVLNFVAIKYII